jgi:pimeloyl-ACP methyl ester carboxylesterase
MPFLQLDGLKLHYVDEGEGAPILLIHGFGSNHEVNWVATGWVETLKRAGRRVIAFDNRGHGQSSVFYNADAYDPAVMAHDAVAVLDALGIEQADIMGYSMGGRIASFMALEHPQRVRKLILGGIGVHLYQSAGLPETVAEAMMADSQAEVTDPVGRMFRMFIDKLGGDRMAMAACIRGSRRLFPVDQLPHLDCPTLVAVGSLDKIAGSGEALAAQLPRGQFLEIPGKDHNPAVGDRVFKDGVVAFLAS